MRIIYFLLVSCIIGSLPCMARKQNELPPKSPAHGFLEFLEDAHKKRMERIKHALEESIKRAEIIKNAWNALFTTSKPNFAPK